jgi:hypothetical protein
MRDENLRRTALGTIADETDTGRALIQIDEGQL